MTTTTTTTTSDDTFENKNDDDNLFRELKLISEQEEVENQVQESKHEIECECEHCFRMHGNDFICSLCGYIKPRLTELDKEWRFFSSESSYKDDPSRCTLRKVNESCSIKKECEKLFNFETHSGKIINDANEIYKSVTKGSIFRGKKRVSIIFACLYYSLHNNNRPYSPEKLLELFDIEKNCALRGLKWLNINPIFKSLNVTKEKEKSGIENLIRELMQDLNASESQTLDVLKIYNLLNGKSSLLNRSRPLSFAVGCVKYYISRRNQHFEIDFSKRLRLSNLTLKRITSEIEMVLH
jgi:transcription initiation factor TFIIIB Brf1 subunit/transcription initiation factor TFIIB